MRRLYEDAAYAPQTGAFWADTVAPLDWPAVQCDQHCDVAVIGGGFTGLNAALTLARAGRHVRLLEAEHPGWGASGRNGGFCCLGGALVSGEMLARQHGESAAQKWHGTERAAIDHVLHTLGGRDADVHSDGETILAHSARAWRGLQADVDQIAATYGVSPKVHAPNDLASAGMSGPWHGGVTIPLGRALNPRKYHSHLASDARAAGVDLHANSPVTQLSRGTQWQLTTPTGTITARQVVLATNGYSAENLPDWLRARTLPVQSTVIVTRPLSAAEQQAAGWTSAQMAYDTRRLLHYFRKLPDGRFLFGMRGGLSASPQEQASIAARIRHDFHSLFPDWRDVEITHEWSGLVCLMRSGHPFCGPMPGHDGLFGALGFHGNGVAMGSYLGHCIAQHMLGTPVTGLPAFLAAPPKRFPLGRHRRHLLRPAYWLADRFDL
ncbi:NAD(P)/FAD-dependent oxidoreductase [Sagittula sp. SSi028]|uniref:NAD(P)/FAD-dependent oxidoreductase n=1 Tax=Sagittula sp. SSi028 TaxID=3400636 RepID=UPI003AF5A54D